MMRLTSREGNMKVSVEKIITVNEGEEHTSYDFSGSKEEIESYIESELDEFISLYEKDNLGIQPFITDYQDSEERQYTMVGTENRIIFRIKF
jgi:hypothetical protein